MKKKLTVVALSLTMALSMGMQSFAATTSIEPQFDGPARANVSDIAVDQNDAPVSYRFNSKLSNVTAEEVQAAKAEGLEIIGKITDPIVIRAKVGLAEASKGKIPTSITTYATLNNQDNTSPTESVARLGGITTTKTNFYDGRYFDQYDRYVVDGPSNFSTSYSKTGTREWNTSATGSVTVSGTVYTVASIEASVSATVGYTFGQSETKTQTYTVDIPSNKYWEIKIWVSYLVYSYVSKVGTTTVATGKTWRPNGLVIQKLEYNK